MNPGLGDMLRIFVVSDATGRTCHTVVQAALSQFNTSRVEVVTLPHVRTFEQIEAILDRADQAKGVVVYTMVAAEFRQRIYELGRLKGVPTVDILGPVLTRFSDILEVSPLAQPGLFYQLDQKYFKHTGFGLFLSRTILGITGITIRETGEPGKGARFEILVPEGAYRHDGI